MLSRRRFLYTAAATAPTLALHAQAKGKHAKPASEPPPPEAAKPVTDDALPAPILALTDRHKDIVPITVQERESRLDLARELMKQYGMDAILITTGASLLYYAGLRWGQSERLFAYVIPQSASPFLICPSLELTRLSESTAGSRADRSPIDILPEREDTQIYRWEESDNPFIIVRRALEEVNVTAGTLGIEEQTSFGFAASITRECPALKIVSATPVTAGCRSLKSPAEIALLRLANNITLDVYRAVYLSCGPGDTNHRFTELVEKAYARCGVRGDASCQVGVNSAIPHGSSKPQTIREKEMVLIDDGCTVEGYTSDISRSFVYGGATDFQKQIFEIVHNAQSAALSAARPGVEMQAVDAAARKTILDAGYGPGYTYFTHRVGHGIGLSMHEWPYLVGGNAQKLAANMLFSNEPGIYLPGKFGVRLEDDMLITERGAELLTAQSASLNDPFGIGAQQAEPKTGEDAKPAETKAPDAPVAPPKN